jgi:hypothetical protein
MLRNVSQNVGMIRLNLRKTARLVHDTLHLRNVALGTLAVLALQTTTSTNAAPASPIVQSATFVSRELVDVEYQSDRSLAILISTPGAVSPGLYRWDSDRAKPRKLCELTAPTFFSFDRRVVIERERGTRSRIRLYTAHDCRMLADIDVDGRVLDIDVRGRYVAAAVRLSDRQLALQLFTVDGKLLATGSIGRNVEMGFSPDGQLLVNFDLSDRGLQAWRLPRLEPIALPLWLHESDVTFVPGSLYVKRYRDDELIIARWPIGTPYFTMPASRTLRLRQLSANGRFGIAHELTSESADLTEELQWIDFKTRLRTVLTRGTIDNAAFAHDLSQAAWSFRLPGNEQRVLVQRKALPPPIATFESPPE